MLGESENTLQVHPTFCVQVIFGRILDALFDRMLDLLIDLN